MAIRPQANTLPDNVEVLDALPTSQGRTKLNSPLHDTDRKVWVKLLADVLQIGTLEHNTFLETLGDQPRQVNGCIDAD
ncbi:MAG: hypothetical protein LQ338_000458 [Usnochroma carphineum]|nr:MAG: hypothetical protein LQ338_000458 [Usnochroma carphineum]